MLCIYLYQNALTTKWKGPLSMVKTSTYKDYNSQKTSSNMTFHLLEYNSHVSCSKALVLPYLQKLSCFSLWGSNCHFVTSKESYLIFGWTKSPVWGNLRGAALQLRMLHVEMLFHRIHGQIWRNICCLPVKEFREFLVESEP